MKRYSEQLRGIILAGAILFATSVLAVVINSLSHGWYLDYTISRYVGLETWSAILFGVGNIAVAYLSWRFLMWTQVEGEISRWLMVILAGTFVIGLLGLSACPMGYFDEPGSAYGSSVPSFIHSRCSRLMFASMLVIAMVFVMMEGQTRGIRAVLAVYIIYGLLCAIAFLTKMEWFSQGILIFEASYIFGFFGICLSCGRMLWKHKDKKEENGRAESTNAKNAR